MLLYATPYQEHTENRFNAGFYVQSVTLWIMLLIDDSHWLWKILSEARGLCHRKEKPSAAHKGGSIFIVRRCMHTCVNRCVITHFTQGKETSIKDFYTTKGGLFGCLQMRNFVFLFLEIFRKLISQLHFSLCVLHDRYHKIRHERIIKNVLPRSYP